MKKRWMVSLICAVSLSAFISYIVKSLEKDDKPKIVVVLKALNTDYWKSMEAGAEKAFNDFHVEGKVVAPASEYRITKQIEMLKSVLKQHPDALIVAPSQPSTAIPVLMEYHQKRTRKNRPSLKPSKIKGFADGLFHILPSIFII